MPKPCPRNNFTTQLPDTACHMRLKPIGVATWQPNNTLRLHSSPTLAHTTKAATILQQAPKCSVPAGHEASLPEAQLQAGTLTNTTQDARRQVQAAPMHQ
jgi:hypothetical protein